MRATAIDHIRARFQSYADMARDISEQTLQQNLPVAKSKTVREHLWCVIGARESYTRALQAGKWSGFSCSLQRSDKAEFIERLQDSTDRFNETVDLIDEWTAERDDLLISLLEHEVMHEGQIIRQMYGLEQSLPKSWKWA